MVRRRDLLKTSLVGLGGSPLIGVAHAAQGSKSGARKKIALVITEYRQNSHADVIGTRLLGGYENYGQFRKPRADVVAMYTDQVPWNDMSRDMAKKYNVPVYDTVAECVTRKTGKLAVDGVVIIGEHGNYPYNEKLQHLYPRYELFAQVVEVFRASGRAVPVFCDKHLSVDWQKAKWMYDQSRALKFPFMAGSSIPVAWRHPEVEMPLGASVPYAVVAAHGPIEAYGFHALEGLQCMVERRKGGETGIAAVQTLEGDEVWRWTDATPWAARLLDAALARSETRKAGSVRANVKKPVVFIVEYRDGLRAAVYMINGHVNDFNFAGEVQGKSEPVSTVFWLQGERFYAHFSSLTHYIEELITTAREPYPVERTLLTTGALAACMDSAWRDHARAETPYLTVAYKAGGKSYFNRGPVPAPEKRT